MDVNDGAVGRIKSVIKCKKLKGQDELKKSYIMNLEG